MTRLMRYLVTLLLLLAAFSGVEGATLVVSPSGGDFTTLQPAVDAALPGDTIEIRPGTYPGDVVVTTPVTINGENGVILGSSEYLAGLIVSTDNVVLHGFSLEGQNVGISFVGSSGSRAEGCQITAGDTGIILSGCNGCSVVDSAIQAGERGIDVNASTRILLSELGVTSESIGIYLRGSDDFSVHQSSLSGGDIGIVADECGNVSLDGNVFSSFGAAFLGMGTSETTIRGSSFDGVIQYIQFYTASGCRVEADTLQGPEYFAADVFSDTEYHCGPWTVTGWDFILLHQPYSAPAGYTLMGDAMNLSFVPDAESSYDPAVLMSARFEGLSAEEAERFGFYRIDEGAPVLVSEMTNESGEYLVEAITNTPGHFALMEMHDAGSGDLLLAGIIILAILAGLGYIVVRKRK